MRILALALLTLATCVPVLAADNDDNAAANERKNRASCANNLKQFGVALNLYESVPVYNTYPPALEILYRDFIADERSFLAAHRRRSMFPRRRD